MERMAAKVISLVGIAILIMGAAVGIYMTRADYTHQEFDDSFDITDPSHYDGQYIRVIYPHISETDAMILNMALREGEVTGSEVYAGDDVVLSYRVVETTLYGENILTMDAETIENVAPLRVAGVALMTAGMILFLVGVVRFIRG